MTEEGTVRIGIIGCGDIVHQVMAPACGSMTSVCVSRVADINLKLANDVADRLGAVSSSDYREVVAAPDVDVVYIATPHWLHAPMAVEALENGKDVIVEKPMATTLRDADAMIDASVRARRNLAVCFDAPFHEQGPLLCEIIAAGGIGRVLSINSFGMMEKPAGYWEGGFTGISPTHWRKSQRESGGGVLMMNMIHAIDWSMDLCSTDVRRVYAELDNFSTPTVEVEDYVSVVLRFANGAIGTISSGSSVKGRSTAQLPSRDYDIIGTRGRVAISRFDIAVYSDCPCIEEFGLEMGKWVHLSEGRENRKEMIRNRMRFLHAFLESLSSGTPFRISPRRARRSLEVVLAAYRSAVEGRPTVLDP